MKDIAVETYKTWDEKDESKRNIHDISGEIVNLLAGKNIAPLDGISILFTAIYHIIKDSAPGRLEIVRELMDTMKSSFLDNLSKQGFK